MMMMMMPIIFFALRSGLMRDIFPTGKSSSPLITALPNQQLLLARDSILSFPSC
jgi:hypothetical protein